MREDNKMKFERFMAKFLRCVRIFGIICIGMALAMFLEGRAEVYFVVFLLLALLLVVGTTIAIKENDEIMSLYDEETEEE